MHILLKAFENFFKEGRFLDTVLCGDSRPSHISRWLEGSVTKDQVGARS